MEILKIIGVLLLSFGLMFIFLIGPWVLMAIMESPFKKRGENKKIKKIYKSENPLIEIIEDSQNHS